MSSATKPATGGAIDDAAAPPIAIGWQTREPPLAACAVVAWADGARRLAARAAAADPRPGELAAIAGVDSLVLLGSAAQLPWIDGALYLGRDARAAGLYLPTTRVPTVPLDLLERALRQRFAAASAPFVVVPREGRVVVLPVGDARAVDRAILDRFASGGGA